MILMFNRKTVSVMLIVIIMSVMTVFTSALSVNTAHSVSLEITDIPFAGIKFFAYSVAEFDSDGRLNVNEDYTKLGIDVNSGSNYSQLTDAVSKYVLSENLTADAVAESDEYGTAVFESSELVCGLYLVFGERYEKDGNIYLSSPFMITLPFSYGNNVEYDVVASAKFDILPKTDTYTVSKIWADDGAEDKRPSKIDIVLYCDGEVYDEISLPHNGSWIYEWQDLPSEHTWWVEEKEVADYECQLTQNGTAFVITNTYTGEVPPVEDIPATGQLWWPVPILTCIGLLFISLGLVRRARSV